MAKKVTVQWCRNRISETLSKATRLPTDAILYSLSMRKVVNSEDFGIYDMALQSLMHDRIVEMTSVDGHKVYKLSA